MYLRELLFCSERKTSFDINELKFIHFLNLKIAPASSVKHFCAGHKSAKQPIRLETGIASSNNFGSLRNLLKVPEMSPWPREGKHARAMSPHSGSKFAASTSLIRKHLAQKLRPQTPGRQQPHCGESLGRAALSPARPVETPLPWGQDSGSGPFHLRPFETLLEKEKEKGNTPGGGWREEERDPGGSGFLTKHRSPVMSLTCFRPSLRNVNTPRSPCEATQKSGRGGRVTGSLRQSPSRSSPAAASRQQAVDVCARARRWPGGPGSYRVPSPRDAASTRRRRRARGRSRHRHRAPSGTVL